MSESRRRKLEMLVRQWARPGHARRSEPAKASPARQDAPGPEPLALADACPGEAVEIDTPMGPGSYWCIRRALAEVCPDEAPLAGQLETALRALGRRAEREDHSRDLRSLRGARAGALLFMDTETCGFSGSMVFLVGLMSWRAGELVFEQCLARDYSQEAAILQAFSQRLAHARALVTFNGKAFDINMIRERAAFHAIALARDEGRRIVHVDLLHEARRRWRGLLPDCRLQTLEAHFCKRRRTGDIPGSAIPDAYHRFVDTGDARQVRDIVHHNLLDLLTLARLLTEAIGLH
jgi:uncharacterized protein YprB with RNaseH-like and TPR domain